MYKRQLKKRGELDDLPELVKFGEALEAASLQTLNDGIMTKDPVSYTHLDVYKRQGRGRAVHECQEHPAGAQDHPPVSYTHLDVYKRQFFGCADAGLPVRGGRGGKVQPIDGGTASGVY